ncbi:putative mitochondrial pteridine transporter ft5 [Leptomonas pyrrhocoris]|uniref:Putative mitochondrial pteridine transporter ft5 n=1 Tax=Leptomonas pyrrhocoris TaxID=157538 RepID=A0A0M9FU14_LEPPY|nr:putative mitochondrial pteridine transporter ft5 [Leptomonas pyrrhocoris]XP_015654369.1 putative mitochondrial pteridine transporter ft5 [Leptomonas pyrrhocoris]KPA75929.1 putative mitochondrial pteridine transporter ft5 [Leptomonas pyrrhocoris]KPA75930.1 putative mitochondrial pteridine transporter ft5 [Leptomonas pyrrhocoris]|eukprot:XP_015654368.1 putative mitochondrial pteridine transporter ft5 [Leptomonas pyrrhocoris]
MPSQSPHASADAHNALDDAIMLTDDEYGNTDDPCGMERAEPPAATAPAANDRWTKETPHEGARRLFRACPWTRSIPVLGNTIAAFGPKLTASVGAFYFMNNGLAENIISASKQPMMMKRYTIDGTRYQRLAGVVTMGSSIKVLMATISDTFAIFGYRKRWYQLGSCVVGFCFCLGYALLPAKPASADTAAAFIFLCTFCRMNSDILTQGHYSRLIRRAPKAGPQLVTWIYWMILIATLIAAVLMGPLADQNKTVNGIFVSAVMHLLPGIIFLFNGYSEKTNQEERVEDARRLREDLRVARLQPVGAPDTSSDVSGEDVRMGIPQETTEQLIYDDEDEHRKSKNSHHHDQHDDNDLLVAKDKLGREAVTPTKTHTVATLDGNEATTAEEWDDVEYVQRDCRTYCGGRLEVNREMVLRNWKIVCYSALMICCVGTMACMTILGTTWDLLYACIVVAVVCIGGAFICLPRVIAKTEVAVFLDFVLYIQLPGALDSFYVADEACVPGGPHFPYSFYTTVGAVIQNVAGLVGVTMFAYVFSKHSFQMVMITTVIMRMVASIFDLMVVERWNLHIGIPDHAMYICGDSIVYQICYQLNYMPLVLVLSRVVPPGSESMVYALMSSIGNLGMTMSNTIGSLLMELAWPIDTTTTPCDFSNVPWLIITGHLAVPVLIIPVSYLFLPRARMCDDIDMNGHVVRKHLEKERAQKDLGAGRPATASEPLHEQTNA